MEMLHAKYESSRPFSFREEEFFFFFCSYVPICDTPPPGGRAGFDHGGGYHMNELGRGLLGDAPYQISKLYAFQFQRRILEFSFFIPKFKLVTPSGGGGGGGRFDPQVIMRTNLVEVYWEMLHTKYQSSKPSIFRGEDFLSFPSLFQYSKF